MKHLLFVSFDLIRPGEIEKSFAIASLLTYLKNDNDLKDKVDFCHISINSYKYGVSAVPTDFNNHLSDFNIEAFEYIAISAYIWNEYLINDFIKNLRKLGFKGKIILGGYQITYSNKEDLPEQYPDVQVFIFGYAEASLKTLLISTPPDEFPIFLNSDVDFNTIPSVYLTNEINVPSGTSMIRMETKRGCPFRCSFCAHRDLTRNRVYKHPLAKVFEEISFVADKKVKRVNILDPIFNVGGDYLDVMKEINQVNSLAVYSLQTRFENIRGVAGTKFIELCAAGKYHLEFGLQTIDPTEADNVNRKNNHNHIEESFHQLNDNDISYEVSLIYGLPGQTVDSFKRSLDYVQSKNCKVIKAYPLMLLRGTELFNERNKWDMKEEAIGDFNIPVVTSSSTFSRNDWDYMNELANRLTPNQRAL